MRLATCLASLVVVTLTGCADAPAREWSAAETIDWANVKIDGQRVLKRRLLRADPIERRVEAYLNRDARVESARFAIVFMPEFGGQGVSDSKPYSFEAVVTTREPMSEADALQLLRDAFAEAQAVGGPWGSHIVRDANAWSASGTIYSTATENVDLSPLGAEWHRLTPQIPTFTGFSAGCF